MAPKNVRLTYIDGRGRAELARILLVVKKRRHTSFQHTFYQKKFFIFWREIRMQLPFSSLEFFLSPFL